MKIGALTLAGFTANARRIVGRKAQVSTRGPIHDAPELLFVFLHPGADGRSWVDERHQVVYTAEQIAELPLQGTVVFLGTCYGLENTAILDALFQAGAAWVVAGPGDNYGGADGVLAGTDVLATAFRLALQAGATVPAAFETARQAAQVAALRNDPGAADALGFKLLSPARDSAAVQTDPRAMRNGKQMVGVVSSLIGLALLFLALFWGSGNDRAVLLTTFSSIPHPPAGVTIWEKDVWRNGVAVSDWWSTPVVVVGAGATVMIEDAVTASATFTLTEMWDTSVLSLTSYTSSSGAITPGSGVLTWVAGSGTLTKTWTVLTGTWSSTLITETLSTASETQTQTVQLLYTAPTATPSPTLTPQVRPTRIDPSTFYGGTPEIWITPYATPYQPERPVVLLFLPLVSRAYTASTSVVVLPATPEVALDGPGTAFSGQALDYTLTVTGTGAGVHTIIFTLPPTTTLVSATPSGYTQSGYDPVVLTWVEEDLETWDGTVRVIAPTLSVTETITARLRVLWESASVTEDVATTVAP